MVWRHAFIVIMQSQIKQNFSVQLEIDMHFYFKKVSKYIV